MRLLYKHEKIPHLLLGTTRRLHCDLFSSLGCSGLLGGDGFIYYWMLYIN